MEDKVTLLYVLLVEEKGYSELDAIRLITKHVDIVANFIMSGNHTLRAAAMALEIAENGERKSNESTRHNS